MSHRTIVTFLLSLVLIGCQKPELTRRYHSVTWGEAKNLVEVNAFTLPVPSSRDQPVVLQLQGDGQAAFVCAVARGSPSPEKLLAVLAKPARDPDDGSGGIDRTVFNRRVVLSAIWAEPFGKTTGPADRIDRLEFDLRLVDPNKAAFKSWNKFSTQYETVDLGKIALDQTGKFSLSGEVTPTPIPAKLSAQVEASRVMKEEVTLHQRYVALGGILDPNVARLFLEGMGGIDLIGNSTIDITLTVPEMNLLRVLHIEGLNSSDDVKDKAIKITPVPVSIPRDDNAIEATLMSHYRVRQVPDLDKASTIVEEDDDVSLLSGTTSPSKVTLVTEREMRIARSLWRVGQKDKQGFMELQLGGVGPVYFASYEEVRTFVRWVKESSIATVDKYSLRWDDNNPLKDDERKQLTVEIITWGRKPSSRPSSANR